MNNNLDTFRESIDKIDSAEFDGHTCFKELSSEQRLDWLAELVVFVYESRSFRIRKNKSPMHQK